LALTSQLIPSFLLLFLFPSIFPPLPHRVSFVYFVLHFFGSLPCLSSSFSLTLSSSSFFLLPSPSFHI
jgi:hypothetical protein